MATARQAQGNHAPGRECQTGKVPKPFLLRLLERYRRADKGRRVDRLTLTYIDGPADIAVDAGVEQAAGSSSAAPLAKVIFTTALYVSPVQTIPS